MKIEKLKVGTVEVLTPCGALVDEDAKKFSRLLLERVRTANPRVVVAMQEVPYVDSAALEGFVGAADELAQCAASLKLAGLTPTCREVLELTGLSHRFRLFNEVHDAVKSYL
ncbi:MAG: STAS domain-containing protein [Planctomycetes bacterium]|nr:STAS domain-containing protein [Planctomycetota bacterium]